MTRNWLEKVDDGRPNFRTYKKQFLAAAYCTVYTRPKESRRFARNVNPEFDRR